MATDKLTLLHGAPGFSDLFEAICLSGEILWSWSDDVGFIAD